MDKSAILDSLGNRTRRWGIRTASDYVTSFAGCLGGGFCPTSLMGVSGEQWGKCLKDAESALTYADQYMLTKGVMEADVPDGGIMAFDCVITSTRRDRDGDVLESSGALLDQKMPLLWQHLPLQPIGKFVKETGRTKRQVAGRFAIADLPLGRDAAVLVKFGALRISHGFQPNEFEPLENEKGEQIGWKIRLFDVMETSLVSVPSNIDAEILSSVSRSKSFAKELDGIRTAYGRDLLQTDLMKRWAKHIHDNRPTVVAVPKQVEPASPAIEVLECVQIDGQWTPLLNGQFVKTIRTSDEGYSKTVDAVRGGCDCHKNKPVSTEAAAPVATKQSCTCPECGHRGPMSDFMGDYDEDDKAASIGDRHFASLLKDTRRMREYRDRLTTVLEARQSEWEFPVDSGLDDLLGIAASAS